MHKIFLYPFVAIGLAITIPTIAFEEKTSTLFFRNNLSYLKAGAPIGIPRAFASLLLDIAQPSLFDKTTTGFPLRVGSKTLSHET